MQDPVRVTVTGPAGQIGYALVPRIAVGDMFGEAATGRGGDERLGGDNGCDGGGDANADDGVDDDTDDDDDEMTATCRARCRH